MSKKCGRQTVRIDNVKIKSAAAIVGEKEGSGPLAQYFDIVLPDNEWNEKTWEKTESKMQREAIRLAVQKSKLSLDEMDRVFSGDLLNQCIGAGAAAAVLESEPVSGDIRVTHLTAGKIVDMGIKDANNMGGAMAPAAYDTIKAHFSELNIKPDDYDMIITGDLGKVGSEILTELLARDGIDISQNYKDCGCMIYNAEEQDVHAGASGCGCIGTVLCGYFFDRMRNGKIKKLLAVGTGALLSPTSMLQGESVPGIAHAVSFEVKSGGEGQQ